MNPRLKRIIDVTVEIPSVIVSPTSKEKPIE
jgi:hypothetical protein